MFTHFLLLMACCTVLLAGQDQCNTAKAITAAILSSFLSSILSAVGRLSFKYANLRDEVRKSFKAHKKLQMRVVTYSVAASAAAAQAATRQLHKVDMDVSRTTATSWREGTTT